MVRKVIFWIFFPLLIIAFFIYFNTGVTHIEFSQSYYRYVQYVSIQFDEWKWFQIPEIPLIETKDFADLEWYEAVLNALTYYVDYLITLINGLSGLINILLSIFKFIMAIVKCVFDAPEIIVPQVSAP